MVERRCQKRDEVCDGIPLFLGLEDELHAIIVDAVVRHCHAKLQSELLIAEGNHAAEVGRQGTPQFEPHPVLADFSAAPCNGGGVHAEADGQIDGVPWASIFEFLHRRAVGRWGKSTTSISCSSSVSTNGPIGISAKKNIWGGHPLADHAIHFFALHQGGGSFSSPRHQDCCYRWSNEETSPVSVLLMTSEPNRRRRESANRSGGLGISCATSSLRNCGPGLAEPDPARSTKVENESILMQSSLRREGCGRSRQGIPQYDPSVHAWKRGAPR